MFPQDTYEVLELLEHYHRKRQSNYQQLLSDASEERAALLLERLAELEHEAVAVIAREREGLQKGETTYLTSGPTLTHDPAHAGDCNCGTEPTFDEALWCALSPDTALDELIDRLEFSSPAASLQELASRLRAFKENRERQIASFARPD